MKAQLLPLITLATALAAAPCAGHIAEASPDPASPLTVASGNAILYRPEFFAKARPSSALEMVQLIPGFTIKGGSLGRGLEGSATNVLIDNRPLPAKGEPLSSVLARIPASSVVAIVRYRSTQPGIDMGGFPEALDIVRFRRTQTGPRKGWPLLPSPDDGRFTMFARATATRAGVSDIGFPISSESRWHFSPHPGRRQATGL